MFSIVLTIHNKESLLERVIRGLIRNTVGDFEIIYVVDGCSDRSLDIVEKRVRPQDQIFITPDLFETKANNIGCKAANGDFIAIVQDDQIVNEYSWNLRMIKPFFFGDIYGVTSGAAHNWSLNPYPSPDSMTKDGWSDLLQARNKSDRSNTRRDSFEIRASGNRGPLVLDHASLRDLDYFDELYAPQDMDDHDLAFRARTQLGKFIGCYWVDIYSKNEWGGTRVGGSPAEWLLKANRENSLRFVDRWKETISETQNFAESRMLKSAPHFRNLVKRRLGVHL
jgi:glycosyltransferase involved in cell wall biosynthesis